jgi:hypothetical protein
LKLPDPRDSVPEIRLNLGLVGSSEDVFVVIATTAFLASSELAALTSDLLGEGLLLLDGEGC